ncbi:MAG: CYTH domain-containing protein [Bacilli bacterium]
MATNIEIEAKVLINEKEYEIVAKHFTKQAEAYYFQTNYYIDTKDFALRTKGIGLRIRQREDKYVITLKTPMSEGLLEKTEPISQTEYELMAEKGIFPETKIRSFLLMMEIEVEKLEILGSLTTERIDVHFESGLFSIDKNTYAGLVDYELEKEGNNLAEAEADLERICEECHVSYKLNHVSKAARTLNLLKKQ